MKIFLISILMILSTECFSFSVGPFILGDIVRPPDRISEMGSKNFKIIRLVGIPNDNFKLDLSNYDIIYNETYNLGNIDGLRGYHGSLSQDNKFINVYFCSYRSMDNSIINQTGDYFQYGLYEIRYKRIYEHSDFNNNSEFEIAFLESLKSRYGEIYTKKGANSYHFKSENLNSYFDYLGNNAELWAYIEYDEGRPVINIKARDNYGYSGCAESQKSLRRLEKRKKMDF